MDGSAVDLIIDQLENGQPELEKSPLMMGSRTTSQNASNQRYLTTIYNMHTSHGAGNWLLERCLLFVIGVLILLLTLFALSVRWSTLWNQGSLQIDHPVNFDSWGNGVWSVFFLGNASIMALISLIYLYRTFKSYTSISYNVRYAIANTNNWADLKVALSLNDQPIIDRLNRVKRMILSNHIQITPVRYYAMMVIMPSLQEVSPNVSRERARILVVLSMIAVPFGLMAVIMYQLISVMEAWHLRKPVCFYDWSYKFKLLQRKEDEMPHASHIRTKRASVKMDKFLATRTNKYVVTVSRFGSFICAMLMGIIALLALIDEDSITEIHLWGRNLASYFVLSGSVFAVFQGNIPDARIIPIEFNEVREYLLEDTTEESARHGYAFRPFQLFSNILSFITLPCFIRRLGHLRTS